MLLFFNIYSYGRIYCLQVDRVAMLLHFHRFYRDAVVQQVRPFPVIYLFSDSSGVTCTVYSGQFFFISRNGKKIII